MGRKMHTGFDESWCHFFRIKNVETRKALMPQMKIMAEEDRGMDMQMYNNTAIEFGMDLIPLKEGDVFEDGILTYWSDYNASRGTICSS